MNTKHTPGPWLIGTVDYGNGDRANANTIVSSTLDKWGQATPIASVHGIALHSSTLEVEKDERAERIEALANARLIAAAPELLGACITLDKWAKECSPLELIKHIDIVVQEARAAIAKATSA